MNNLPLSWGRRPRRGPRCVASSQSLASAKHYTRAGRRCKGGFRNRQYKTQKAPTANCDEGFAIGWVTLPCWLLSRQFWPTDMGLFSMRQQNLSVRDSESTAAVWAIGRCSLAAENFERHSATAIHLDVFRLHDLSLPCKLMVNRCRARDLRRRRARIGHGSRREKLDHARFTTFRNRLA